MATPNKKYKNVSKGIIRFNEGPTEHTIVPGKSATLAESLYVRGLVGRGILREVATETPAPTTAAGNDGQTTTGLSNGAGTEAATTVPETAPASAKRSGGKQ